MKKQFITTVLYNTDKYDEGKVYDLDKETAETLKHFVKEPDREAASEDGDNSSNDKPSGK